MPEAGAETPGANWGVLPDLEPCMGTNKKDLGDEDLGLYTKYGW